MRISSRLSIAVLVAGLSACATQPPPAPVPETPHPPVKPAAPVVSTAEQQTLQALITAQDRLYRVGAPLLINNTPLCRHQARNLLGFTAKNKYSYSTEFVNAAEQVLNLNDRLQVTGVLAGSGAAKAGVRKGDLLMSVEDTILPEGPNAETQARTVLAPLVNGRTSVKLTVLRTKNTVELNVPLTHACAFGIELGNADHVNAYADGQRVLLTRGMLAFTRTDDEVAYVLATEMAHNALGHTQRLRLTATMDGIIDNLVRIHPELGTMNGMAGVKPFTGDIDGTADTLALYMLVRAGYDIDGAPAFWQRLADRYPATVPNGYTAIHPALAARLASMKKTIAEIKAKQASNATLLPTPAKTPPTAPKASSAAPKTPAAQAPNASATR